MAAVRASAASGAVAAMATAERETAASGVIAAMAMTDGYRGRLAAAVSTLITIEGDKKLVDRIC